ncbi:tetratricopeptide repeat protein [Haliea sp. E17]|uniref:tetratricopeptide repeat protein n=1 Tax=Haliea sp. E17 TaxID=3401576 RepID=UPI003AB0235C
MRLFRQLPLVLLLVLLGACSSVPRSTPRIETGQPTTGGTSAPQPAPTTAPEPRPGPAPQPELPDTTTSAHDRLLAQAEDARDRGRYDQAMAYLERAQRIDPDNADIYLDMAITYTAAGRQDKARTMAERGLLYCTSSRQCNALRSYLD